MPSPNSAKSRRCGSSKIAILANVKVNTLHEESPPPNYALTFTFEGITYIKYSKTSEAARAMEAMNGETIGNAGRQLKVLIAAR